MDAHPNNIGTIISVTQEIETILGYEVSDLVDTNIAVVMPKILSDIHTDLMRSFFRRGKSEIVGRERIVYPINSQGYIVPCNLFIKVLPQIVNGIQIAAFLSKIDPSEGAITTNADLNK